MRGFVDKYKQFLAALEEPKQRRGESIERFCKRYADWQEHYRKLYAELAEKDDGLPELR